MKAIVRAEKNIQRVFCGEGCRRLIMWSIVLHSECIWRLEKSFFW